MISATTKLLPRGAVTLGAHASRVAVPSTARGLHSTATRSAPSQSEPQSKTSSSKPPQPKIINQSVPGVDRDSAMSEEAKEEVRRHNEDFAKKHDHADSAPDDKVDKKFWER
jgi:hypothetical protein